MKNPNIKISVQNDGKCAALAELWMGNLKDVKKWCCTSIRIWNWRRSYCEQRIAFTGSHFFGESYRI